MKNNLINKEKEADLKILIDARDKLVKSSAVLRKIDTPRTDMVLFSNMCELREKANQIEDSINQKIIKIRKELNNG